MADIFNTENLGNYYVDTNNNLYRFIGYCDYPTVTLEDVETKEKITFAINGLTAQKYVRLIKEQQC